MGAKYKGGKRVETSGSKEFKNESLGSFTGKLAGCPPCRRGKLPLTDGSAEFSYEGSFGIVLERRTEIESNSVISNADYKTTFLKLINRDILAGKWYGQSPRPGRQDLSCRCVSVFMKKG
jgi:hypothetical protein